MVLLKALFFLYEQGLRVMLDAQMVFTLVIFAFDGHPGSLEPVLR